MFWSFLFVVGLIQGGFLFLVFAVRPGGNRPATRLMQALFVLFGLSNFDDLLLSAGFYRTAPLLFGYSLGAAFAYGPLFYLYIRAVASPGFRWKRTVWLHFLPALLYLALNLPFLMLPGHIKIRLLDDFVAGRLPVRGFNAAVSTAQIFHLFLYILAACRLVRAVRRSPEATVFRVSLQRRAAWLDTLVVLFSLFLFALIALFAANLSAGYYVAGANYVFTIVTSAMLYLIAFKLMLQPELVTPGFEQKYGSFRLGEAEERNALEQLKRLLEQEKSFTDPDLTLGALAARLNLSPHRLSMLVNDKYGVSFSDFINKCRVEEFIARLNDPRFAHYTLHGLALEVGFNSKSAFNAAFKKMTGKPPSAFKTEK